MLDTLLKKLTKSDLQSLMMCFENETTYIVKLEEYYIAVNDLIRDYEIERKDKWSCGKVLDVM